MRTAQMTPGTYLRLRRQAAHMTLHEVALYVPNLLDGSPAANIPAAAITRDVAAEIAAEVVRVRRVIEEAEADRYFFGPERAAELRRAFPLDPHVYADLVTRHGADPVSAARLPLPQVCTDCGCSWHDPCEVEEGIGCSWADQSATLCTACALSATQAALGSPRTATPPPASSIWPAPRQPLAGQPGFTIRAAQEIGA